MGQLTIEIKDDNGKVIGKKTYELSEGQTLSAIESEVEKLRKSLLPDITKDLFEAAQLEYKKNSISSEW